MDHDHYMEWWRARNPDVAVTAGRPRADVRDGWVGGGDEFSMAENPDARVRVVHTSIIGFVGTDEVARYDTSGVWPHKVAFVMRQVEEHVGLGSP
jgi:hypothetical protein